MSDQLEVTNFTPLVVGKRVVISLDIGWKYLMLHMKTHMTAAQMLDPVLKINGKPVHSGLESFQFHEDKNTHYNLPQVAGIRTLCFIRPELADPYHRDNTGLGTIGLDTVQFEFTIKSDVVSPVLSVLADVTVNEPLGMINLFESANINLTGTGKNPINKMPAGSGEVCNYWISKATMDITDLELIRVIDGSFSTVLKSTKEFLELKQKQAPMKPRVPVTGSYTCLDFLTSGMAGDVLQTKFVDVPGKGRMPIERTGLDITVATNEPLTVITESVGTFNG